MLQTINCFLSYVIDLVLLINLIVLFVLFSRLRWISALMFAVVFYITFALFLINVGVDFIGMLYFIVYLGAIMTLFLFAVMFLHTRASFKAYTSKLFPLVFELKFIWTQSGSHVRLAVFVCKLCLVVLKLKYIYLLDKLQPWAYTFPFLYQSKKELAFGIKLFTTQYTIWQEEIHAIISEINFAKTMVRTQTARNLFVQIVRIILYLLIFVGIIVLTTLLDNNFTIFGFYSEEIFFYLGSALELLRRSLFVGLQLEFILVGLIFWVAFICVLTLLYKKK